MKIKKLKMKIENVLYINQTKVRPLLTLSHRGYDNTPLLIVFSANYIDQSNLTLMRRRYFGSRLHARGNANT